MPQGPWGPRGTTGPTGMTGRRGLQGDGRGPTGPNLYSGGTLRVVSTTATDLTVTAADTGTYYIKTSGSTINLTLPIGGLTQGMFWVVYNATNAKLFVYINYSDGARIAYRGNVNNFAIFLAPGNGNIIAYSGTGNSFIAF